MSAMAIGADRIVRDILAHFSALKNVNLFGVNMRFYHIVYLDLDVRICVSDEFSAGIVG